MDEYVKNNKFRGVISRYLYDWEYLANFDINVIIDELEKNYGNIYRYYHNHHHVLKMLELLENNYFNLNETNKLTLALAIIYHDVIYVPGNNDNEEKSIELFYNHFEKITRSIEIENLIRFTSKLERGKSNLEKIFFKLDWNEILDDSFSTLLNYEIKIRSEFQKFPYNLYKEKRVEFLNFAKNLIPENKDNINILIEYVKSFRPTVGVYSGSFNPFHIGHLNIIHKAAKMFDKVIVVQAVNPEKTNEQLYKTPDWASRIGYEVDICNGLITDYINKIKEFGNPVLIRGIRNGYDLNMEYNQLQFIKEYDPDINHVMIFCDSDKQHISSSTIRSLEIIDPLKSKKFLV